MSDWEKIERIGNYAEEAMNMESVLLGPGWIRPDGLEGVLYCVAAYHRMLTELLQDRCRNEKSIQKAEVGVDEMLASLDGILHD